MRIQALERPAQSPYWLDATLLRRPAAVVWNRSHVHDCVDRETGGLKRPDGSLSPRPRALYEDIECLNSVFHGLACRRLCRLAGSKGRALTRSLESGGPSTGRVENIPIRIGDRNQRIV